MRAIWILPVTLSLLAALPGPLWAQGGGEEGGGGLFDINTGVSVWTLFVFIGLLLILSKYAWAPILAAVDAREKGIRAALDEAAQRNAEAARAALRSEGVRVHGEELGGGNGRTVRLEVATGQLTAATAGQAAHEL